MLTSRYRIRCKPFLRWVVLDCFVVFLSLMLVFQEHTRVVQAGAAAEGPNLWVFAIGIDKYSTRSYRNLLDATSDARSLGSAFASDDVRQPFSGVKVITLLDSDATLAKVRALFDELARAANPQDVFIFDFSGHGMGRRARWFAGLEKDEYQFLLSDTQEGRNRVTNVEEITNALSAHELSALLLSLPARRQIVILDTSDSAEAFEAIQKTLNADSIFTLQQTGRRFALFGIEGPGFDLPGHEHGVLTQALLDGMAGAADVNHDGVITEGELEGYVMAHIPVFTEEEQLISYSNLRGLCLSSKNPKAYCNVDYGFDERVNLWDRRVQPSDAKRGLSAEDPAATKSPSLGTDYALILAGDNYDHWSRLSNPIYDSQTLSKELIANFGYTPGHIVTSENPTKLTILDRLTELERQRFDPNDRLLIYIAGHGYMDGDEGFVVTRDTQLPSEDRYLETGLALSRLRDKIDNLPVRHILVVLDVCYGGVFKESKMLPSYSVATLDTPQPVETIVDKKMKEVSRLYIASGGLRQAFDGEPGRHSPFARTFLKTLRQYGGQEHLIDMGKLESAVYGLCPHPYSGTFGSHHDEGDFVFVPRAKPASVPDPGLDTPTPSPHCSG